MPAAAVFLRHQAIGSTLLQQHCSLLEGKLLSLQRKAGHQALGSEEVEVRGSLRHLRRSSLSKGSREQFGPGGHQTWANQPEVVILSSAGAAQHAHPSSHAEESAASA